MTTILAKDIMTPTDLTVSPDMTVTNLVQILRERRIGGVPVLDQNKMIGIVSVADIFLALQIVQRMHLGKLLRFSQQFEIGKKMILVKDIYRAKLKSVKEETPSEEILDIMIQEDLYTLPVMNEARTIVYGVIGRHDVTWAVFGSQTV